MRIRSTVGLLALLGTPLAAQETVQLRLSGQPGQINRYVMTMDMFIRGGPMASMMSTDTTLPMTRITSFATRTLTAVNRDTLTYTEVIDSARFESPAMPQMAQMAGPQAIAAMTGTSTVTKMDPSGQIHDLQVIPGPGAAAMMGNRPQGGRGGPGGMMGNMGNRPMYAFPNRPVRVGESWTSSDTINAEGTTTMVQSTYRLERVENQGGARIAVVSLSGTMGVTTPAGPLNLTSQGEIQLDLSGSRLSTFTMTTSGVMNNPQMGETPVKMVMNLRLM